MLFRNVLNQLGVQLCLVENASKSSDYAEVDLSEENLGSKKIDASNHEELQQYLDEVQYASKAKVLYGGYLEKRNLYANSVRFNAEEIRNIHLGVDFWASAGTGILAPIDGMVHSAHYNEGEGNYGGTIILKHTYQDFTFYSLYGHLSRASLVLPTESFIQKGKVFCYLGESHENGNYVPHLHFQWILDIPKGAKDYPGVCSENQIANYSKNSPKPEVGIENS